MFTAVLLVCSLQSGITDYNNCIEFKDNDSPYLQKELCEAKTKELSAIISLPSSLDYIYFILNYPENIISIQQCIPGGDLI